MKESESEKAEIEAVTEQFEAFQGDLEKLLIKASDWETREDVYDSLLAGGETVTLELDIIEATTILGELEQSVDRAQDAVDLLLTVSTFLEMADQCGEEVEERMEEILTEHEEEKQEENGEDYSNDRGFY